MAVHSLKNKKKIQRVTALRIAGLVPCDYRTVEHYFDGGRGSFAVVVAIQRALKELNIPDPRAEPATEAP
ncbi:MAG: hypothetical protein ABI488_00185 [Polyangiaceae bacterium]